MSQNVQGINSVFMFQWLTRWVQKNPKPLGRWSHCGDKKKISEDVLEFKIRQKARRQFLLETGTDPYHLASHPRLKTVKVFSEEYMRPFVVQS